MVRVLIVLVASVLCLQVEIDSNGSGGFAGPLERARKFLEWQCDICEEQLSLSKSFGFEWSLGGPLKVPSPWPNPILSYNCEPDLGSEGFWEHLDTTQGKKVAADMKKAAEERSANAGMSKEEREGKLKLQAVEKLAEDLVQEDLAKKDLKLQAQMSKGGSFFWKNQELWSKYQKLS